MNHYTSRCRRSARLASLCRVFPDAHWNRPSSACLGAVWHRSERHGLRAGCQHHRPVLSVFPWAPFRSTKVAVKLHTLWDLRGNLPTFLHISDENCTMSMSSPVAPRAGCLLCHGPRLSRLRTAPWPARRGQLLCDPRQIQPPSPSSVFASGRPEHGG